MKKYFVDVSHVGTISWYSNSMRTVFHREDGPAVQFANGTKFWYVKGKLHRIDGPAVERASGDKFWYKNGKSHREDGPAIEWATGEKEWYINGKKMTEEEHKTATCVTKELTIGEIENVLGYKVKVGS